METVRFFPYQWHVADNTDDCLMVKVFGLNEKDESVFALITDFAPFVYFELPPLKWTPSSAQLLGEKLDELLGYNKPISKSLVYKSKLYYAHYDKVDDKYQKKKFPYLKCHFRYLEHIKKASYAIRKPLYVSGVGAVNLKIHENKADPVLQITCLQDIPTAGWIQFKGRKIRDEDKYSSCDHEYTVSYKSLTRYECDKTVRPKILSFDIEVNSSEPTTFPDAKRPGDKVFQCSCVLGKQGTKEDKWDKVLLTLGEPDPEVVGEDVEIRLFDTEADLLVGFTELIQEKNPQIITGYNIFMFDIPYMIDRAKYNRVIGMFDQMSYIQGLHAKETLIKWSSSAYKNQEFLFLDAEGRLFVDLHPLIKRDYKFDNYKLKTVSEHFLGETKDPLSPKGIFKCYRIFSGKSLGIVGKYCVQDAALVLKLFETIQTWIGLTEMANTCNVPIFYLYTQGQQIKVFSQVYKKCMYEERVVENDGYVPKEDESYTGAYVVNPVPGLYDMVESFDFSSLYPTTIIAYNIDMSSLVKEDPKNPDPSIPDEDCHVFEWEDHVGCEHDTTVRKSKPKHVICTPEPRRYRYLKEPKGILPTILQNLLDARKKTNRQIEELKEKKKSLSGKEKEDVETLINVLDKRQLSFKVSANSMYGAMGVKRGYLPFMPGAMCTTARGRQSIEKAGKYLQETYGGQLIYGDTDSCYVHFPHLKDAQETWDFCKKIEQEMLNLYPRPMKLAFEEKIFWRFFILTKKRYMALSCDVTGKVSNKIFTRGVLLARRDNSKFIRTLYSDMIMKIFYRAPREDVLNLLMDRLNELFSGSFDYKNFVITKSVGAVEDYAIRPLNDDVKKATKRLKELDLGDYSDDPELVQEVIGILKKSISGTLKDNEKFGNAYEVAQQYIGKNLPAQVQLAERMRSRGKPVSAGSRLEYVITDQGVNDRLSSKMEDAEYFKEHSSTLKIDYHYYLRLTMNPVDQALEVAYNLKKFVAEQIKLREKKAQLLTKLKNYFTPKITLVD